VSALGQVVALHLKSNLKSGVEFVDSAADEAFEDKKGEIEYDFVINRVLPPSIRVLGWCPVKRDFSARFSCLYRTYRYFFVKRTLNIGHMQEAASYLVGEHDFRNFCKMDVVNCSNFVRNIQDVKVLQHNSYNNSSGGESGNDVYYVEIKGTAFLWHQVRCMMSVLFLVGDGREAPTIVKDMLDLAKMPRKPTYPFASELPLVLYDCAYSPEDISGWHKNSHNEDRLYKLYQDTWEAHAIGGAKAELFSRAVTISPALSCSFDECRRLKNHVPLAKRPSTCKFTLCCCSLFPRGEPYRIHLSFSSSLYL
jgi:tRNA pseudouridine38/39 synthase